MSSNFGSSRLIPSPFIPYYQKELIGIIAELTTKKESLQEVKMELSKYTDISVGYDTHSDLNTATYWVGRVNEDTLAKEINQDEDSIINFLMFRLISIAYLYKDEGFFSYFSSKPHKTILEPLDEHEGHLNVTIAQLLIVGREIGLIPLYEDIKLNVDGEFELIPLDGKLTEDIVTEDIVTDNISPETFTMFKINHETPVEYIPLYLFEKLHELFNGSSDDIIANKIKPYINEYFKQINLEFVNEQTNSAFDRTKYNKIVESLIEISKIIEIIIVRKTNPSFKRLVDTKARFVAAVKSQPVVNESGKTRGGKKYKQTKRLRKSLYKRQNKSKNKIRKVK